MTKRPQRAAVARAATSAGFAEHHTGGNCLAYHKPAPDPRDRGETALHRFWLLTSEAGLDVPERVDEPVWLGLYDESDGQAVAVFVLPTLADALAVATGYLGPE